MSENAANLILEYGQTGAQLRETFFANHADLIVEVGRMLAITLVSGGKILLCGNGGSAADAQHLAVQLSHRFELDRPPLPAIALTTDASTLTAVGNDDGFEFVFQKQVQALGEQGDALVAISTSGNSENVIHAIRTAHDKGMSTVGLLGGEAGDMVDMCDYTLHVPNKRTPLVQEAHMAIGHALCRLIDYYLFEAVLELQPYMEPGAK